MLTCIERSHPSWAVVRLRKLLTSRKHALRRWRADAHYNPMIGASEPASAGTSSGVPIAASENSAPDFDVIHGGRSRHGFPKLNQISCKNRVKKIQVDSFRTYEVIARSAVAS